ncbi:MAG: MucR family transcriptional regulator [Alphaproteobacteria bacterium]|nr:MucR family transcriptional regulator [Alphaproteobacteria bacterium]
MIEGGCRTTLLSRHLKTAYNLTPEQYRSQWGFPDDYPMVAPNYTKRRSNNAKSMGLGFNLQT